MREKLLATLCLGVLLGSTSACSFTPDDSDAEPGDIASTAIPAPPRDQGESFSTDRPPNDSETGSGGHNPAEPERRQDERESDSQYEDGSGQDAVGEEVENQPLPEEPPHDAFEPDDGNIADAQDEPLEYTSAPGDWWGEDYCHYFIQDGVTYGDLCISQYAADYYLVHRFDPSQPGNQGTVLMQYYTAVPQGWVMYRDWTDPNLASNPEITWLYHPADPTQATAENFWVVMNDGSSYTLAYIQALVAGAGGGTDSGANQHPGGLPAWDPAFMPINQLALDIISKNIRSTNPGIY